jgi:hypothetical protein
LIIEAPPNSLSMGIEVFTGDEAKRKRDELKERGISSAKDTSLSKIQKTWDEVPADCKEIAVIFPSGTVTYNGNDYEAPTFVLKDKAILKVDKWSISGEFRCWACK